MLLCYCDLLVLDVMTLTLVCVWQPVLDIKPYLPYCDAVPDAIAPSWVKVIFFFGSYFCRSLNNWLLRCVIIRI